MRNRYKSETHMHQAESIFKLKPEGKKFQEIAQIMGMTSSNVQQTYYRECRLRELFFYSPFAEYLPTRLKNAIRRCLGEAAFADPEKFNKPEIISTLRIFPGVGDKSLHLLAEALTEAGYESFDLEKVKEGMFGNKNLPQGLSQ